MNPSLTDLHTSSSKESPPILNSPPANFSSTIPTPSPRLLPLGRHQAPASAPNISSFFSRHTSTKMALRTWQLHHNQNNHTPNPHSKNSSRNTHNEDFRNTKRWILQEPQRSSKIKPYEISLPTNYPPLKLCPNIPELHTPLCPEIDCAPHPNYEKTVPFQKLASNPKTSYILQALYLDTH